MLQVQSENLARDAIQLQLHWNQLPLTTGQMLELLRADADFRAQWISALAGVPFAAYFWETPPIISAQMQKPFECVLTEARGLADAAPDLNAFADHFSDDEVVVFENLGGDATLVVPCPLASAEHYAHLASFLRGAPAAQRHSLFQRAAEEVLARVSNEPIWLSTAGMGVYWLHVRLDARPKYYRHGPYRTLLRA